jgi:hypothetical protein
MDSVQQQQKFGLAYLQLGNPSRFHYLPSTRTNSAH